MLTLKLMTPEDCQKVADWNRGKDSDYLIQWSGPHSYSYPITAEQVIPRCTLPNCRLYLICDGAEAIGAMELDEIDLERKRALAARFILAEEKKGRGHGTEALNLLSNLAYEEFGITYMRLVVYCYNVSALRCYEKSGYRVAEYVPHEDPKWNKYIMNRRLP